MAALPNLISTSWTKARGLVNSLVLRNSLISAETDNLSTYKPVVERLSLDHRNLPRARHGMCMAHVQKNVWSRLRRVDGWEWYKGRLWCLLTELPEGGDRELVEMERLVRGEPGLRSLVVELCGKWKSPLCHRRVNGVPHTNPPRWVLSGR